MVELLRYLSLHKLNIYIYRNLFNYYLILVLELNILTYYLS